MGHSPKAKAMRRPSEPQSAEHDSALRDNGELRAEDPVGVTGKSAGGFRRGVVETPLRGSRFMREPMFKLLVYCAALSALLYCNHPAGKPTGNPNERIRRHVQDRVFYRRTIMRLYNALRSRSPAKPPHRRGPKHESVQHRP